MLSFFSKLFGENKFVNSVNFLPANIKAINPMQKCPHIIESFACIRKTLDIVFIHNKFLNFFRNMFITKTIKINDVIFVTK